MLDPNFTSHGFRRVYDRLSLDHTEVAEILTSRKAICLGSEAKNPDRMHWLFYSIPDSDWFVVVQDQRNAEIITVLPIHYHENIAWNISNDTLKAAERLMHRDNGLTMPPKSLSDRKSETSPPGSPLLRESSKMKLIAVLESEGVVKHVNLGSVSAVAYLANPTSWRIDRETLSEIKGIIADRGFEWEQLVLIVGKIGKRGDQFAVHYDNEAA